MEQQNNQVNADTAIILVAIALLAPFMLPAAILLTFAKAEAPIKEPAAEIKQKQMQEVIIVANQEVSLFENAFNKLACAYRNVD